jgi:hypothetical protein
MPENAIPIASPRHFSNQFAITSEHGMTVEAPTHIPNRPLIARNSPKEVARLSANLSTRAEGNEDAPVVRAAAGVDSSSFPAACCT